MRRRAVLTFGAVAGAIALFCGAEALGQTQARPKPVAPPVKPPAPVTADQQPSTLPPAPVPGPEPAADTVTEATLGVPFFPNMQFIESLNAGSGQRYYLFGTVSSFSEVVNYYKSVLKQRGELVFEVPATHQFDIGRFNEDTMAFPPSVTVKDYMGVGLQGYPNPKAGAQPSRFGTIVQIVPIPAAPPAGAVRK
jgi:hypothetical protein